MDQEEATQLTRLRHAQSTLWQFIAAGLDFDGSHRQAMADVDRAIVSLVACRWRGQAGCTQAIYDKSAHAQPALGRAA